MKADKQVRKQHEIHADKHQAKAIKQQHHQIKSIRKLQKEEAKNHKTKLQRDTDLKSEKKQL
jgi:hypothetical protein